MGRGMAVGMAMEMAMEMGMAMGMAMEMAMEMGMGMQHRLLQLQGSGSPMPGLRTGWLLEIVTAMPEDGSPSPKTMTHQWILTSKASKGRYKLVQSRLKNPYGFRVSACPLNRFECVLPKDA